MWHNGRFASSSPHYVGWAEHSFDKRLGFVAWEPRGYDKIVVEVIGMATFFTRHFYLGLLWLLLLFLLAACGENEETAVSSTPSPPITTAEIGMETAVSTATISPTGSSSSPATSHVVHTPTPIPTNFGGATQLPTWTPSPFPSATELQARLESQHPAHYSAVAIQGSRAYLAFGKTLFVVDVSNPYQPQLIKAILLRNRINQVQIESNYVYAALGTPGDIYSDRLDTGLEIIDISNQSTFPTIAFYSTDFSVKRVEVFGNVTFMTLRKWGGFAYDDLLILDVSDPIDPVEFSNSNQANINSGDLHEVSNESFYLLQTACNRQACHSYLTIFDVSHPLEPKFREEGFSLLRLHVYLDIAVRDDYAYLIGPKNIKVLDISHQSQPTVVGYRSIPLAGHKLELVDHYAYVAFREGLQIIDIAEPTELQTVNSLYPDVYFNDIVEANGYIYLLDWDNGLIILDVSDPVNPVGIGKWQW